MTLPRRAAALAAGGLAVAAVATAPAAGAHAAASSSRQVYRVSGNGVLTLQGHGYGHGHGMSQFGAYGAALKGLTAAQIVAFYYPHTSLAHQPLSTRVRVLLGRTSHTRLVVSVGGGRLTAGTSVPGVADCSLPASIGGRTVTQWRARVVDTAGGTPLRLQDTTDGSSWSHPRASACGKAWAQPLDGDVTFTGRSVTRLVHAGGGVTRYRGTLRAAFTGSGIFVVNDAPLDSYLRSVVPSEMPSSWSAAALQAQAIAARTYASYGIAHPKSKAYYDVFDDTRDQMYVGVGAETSSSDAAVTATENAKRKTAVVVHDAHGRPAFTQFSSSDGGWTVAGGQPYLPAERDPYDGVPQVSWNPHTWVTTLSTSSIESAFPSLGHLRALVVDARDGHGQWGGRITTLTLRGSSGHVNLSGVSFRYDFGLRSEWFQVLQPPGAPGRVTAHRTRGSVAVGWSPAAARPGARVTGYRVTVEPGGASTTVGRDATSATVTGLHRGTDYTVRVVARSRAGTGPATVVTTKVGRLGGADRVHLAVAASRTEFGAGKAGAVVLTRRSLDAFAFAAGPLAAARRAPLLLTGVHALPAATKAELQRVLPRGRTVYVLGPTSDVGHDVVSALRAAGYRTVRYGGSTPDRSARAVADAVATGGSIRSVFEVSRDDAAAAAVAAPAAVTRGGVVLLTDGTAQSPATRSWLAAHPGVKRFAVGAVAASADPGAHAVGASDAVGTAVAVAQRFFPHPRRIDVAAVVAAAPGLVAAVRRALSPGPVLLAEASRLDAVTRSYLRAGRTRVSSVTLVGGHLPYDRVESDTQRALVG